jgi:putative endonuclease
MKSSNIGKTGEDIACRYLKQKGHRIVDRNFRMKFGEIDVVSEKDRTVYFTEVKTFSGQGAGPKSVGMSHRPEENVDVWKIKKLSRVVQVYLSEKYRNPDTEWEFLVVAIVLDIEKKTAHVKVIQDVLS